MKRVGKFISFEGIDGSGKTTQIRLLEKSLKDLQIPVLMIREPEVQRSRKDSRYTVKCRPQ